MKKFLLAAFPAVLLFINFSLEAQDLKLQWVNGINGTESIDPNDIEVDNNGNVYLVGKFWGTADFDPGPATVNLTTGITFWNGGSFLVKYDANGDYAFAHSIGDSGLVNLSHVHLDLDGTIWIAGTFKSTADLDPGPGIANFTSTGDMDIFVAQYNANGDYLSAFTVGGKSLDSPYDLALDLDGNILITGIFKDTVDFDPGPGIHNLETTNTNIFLAKYSSSGVLHYAFNLETSYLPHSLIVDDIGNAYLSGQYMKTIDLNPGSGTAMFTAIAGIDGFWAKYNVNGDYISGYSYQGGANFLALDGSKHLYISGRVPDSMDVDPGPGVAMLYSKNNFDVYFAKYDQNAHYLHARVFESNNTYTQNGITTDFENSLYLFGRFPDTVNFNPGGNAGTVISKGNSDAFITKFDEAGSFKFVYSIGSWEYDHIKAMATDLNGNIWLAGSFKDSVDFDFGASSNILYGPNKGGSFIAKYKDLTITGIEELQPDLPSIKIYSVENDLLIDFSALQEVEANIQIYNLLGQKVHETEHTQRDILKINMINTASHIYLVAVRNGNAAIVQKIFLN